MALALSRKSLETEVFLVEKAGRFGRGLAYGTSNDQHVVNAMPTRLSAFEHDPTHFLRWLQRSGRALESGTLTFVPRRLVGEYLDELLEAAGPNLSLVRDEVTSLNDVGAGVEISLKSGPLSADAVILATGHDWIHRSILPATVPPDAPVVILGTGLSMVDRWLSLRSSGHRGPIVARSRRGLIPHAHAPAVPLELDAATLPVGRPVSQVLGWLRRQAEIHGDWRSVVDAIRPFAPRLWEAWTPDRRARFLRHARPWWDIHRHRLAPSVHARLQGELRAGTVEIRRGSGWPSEPSRDRLDRGSGSRGPIEVPYVFDCRGLRPAWDDLGSSLIGSLLRWGDARPDPLGLSLDVTTECRLIGADGMPSSSLYAIGPLTRGRFWEIDAIPEIRAQCEQLASHLAETVFYAEARSRYPLRR
jgi:uncharacterized NAD(P)/FAD-binding protein YdhS